LCCRFAPYAQNTPSPAGAKKQVKQMLAPACGGCGNNLDNTLFLLGQFGSN